MDKKSEEIDSLKEGEVHPAAYEALDYIKNYISDSKRFFKIKESLSSCSLAGNRAAKIYCGTLHRLINHEPIGEIYILGLAFFLSKIQHISRKKFNN